MAFELASPHPCWTSPSMPAVLATSAGYSSSLRRRPSSVFYPRRPFVFNPWRPSSRCAPLPTRRSEKGCGPMRSRAAHTVSSVGPPSIALLCLPPSGDPPPSSSPAASLCPSSESMALRPSAIKSDSAPIRHKSIIVVALLHPQIPHCSHLSPNPASRDEAKAAGQARSCAAPPLLPSIVSLAPLCQCRIVVYSEPHRPLLPRPFCSSGGGALLSMDAAHELVCGG